MSVRLPNDPSLPKNGLTLREQLSEEERVLHKATKYTIFQNGGSVQSSVDSEDEDFVKAKFNFRELVRKNAKSIKTSESDDRIKASLYEVLNSNPGLIPKAFENVVVDEYIRDVHKYAVIDDLMNDSEVSDIQIVGTHAIYYVKSGKTLVYHKNFETEQSLSDFIEIKLSKTPFSHHKSDTSTDAFLEDGSRVQVKNSNSTGITYFSPKTNSYLVKPSMIVTIRKFIRDYSLRELVDFGMLTEQMVEYLQLCIQSEHSMIVSGYMGSGKTSLMNALFELFDPSLTSGIVEEATEMKPHHLRCIRMWERKGNNENERGSVTMEDHIKDAMRMNLQYLCVGEVRTPSVAYEFAKASDLTKVAITTTHARNPEKAVSRIVSLATSERSRPSQVQVQWLMEGVKTLIHIRKYKDGIRRVSHISELLGFQDGLPVTRNVFSYSPTKKEFVYHGVSEDFRDNADEFELTLPDDWLCAKGVTEV